MGPAEILHEFTRLAAEPGGLTERAEALLAHLQRVVPFDAGGISLLTPEKDGMRPSPAPATTSGSAPTWTAPPCSPTST